MLGVEQPQVYHEEQALPHLVFSYGQTRASPSAVRTDWLGSPVNTYLLFY